MLYLLIAVAAVLLLVAMVLAAFRWGRIKRFSLSAKVARVFDLAFEAEGRK